MKITCSRGLLLALWLFSMRAPGAGVTVVTHGFTGNADGWVLQMCRRIAAHPRFPQGGHSLYEITISKPGGVFSISKTLVEGSNPLSTPTGEIIIALDWGTVSGLFQASTSEIALQLASALSSTNFFPELGGRALCELPLHLVGHSRGASVMAETSRILGAQGIWIDHLTLLDPYPLGTNGDPTARIYANVLFAENYRQTYNFPTGQSVAGAYERVLTGLNAGGHPAGSEHSDVHLWYHGTVDYRTPVTPEGATITANERLNWWTPAEQQGTNAGFVYSRLAGGNRLLFTNPSGASGAVVDGMNKLWDFGAGLSPNRTALPQNSGAWPNVITFSLSRSTNGGRGTLTAWVSHQHGVLSSDVAELEVGVDPDLNPWNSNELSAWSRTLAGTGTSLVGMTNGMLIMPLLPPGDYNVLSQLRRNNRQRLLYTGDTIRVPPVLANAAKTNTDFVFTVLGKVGWNIVVETSGSSGEWTPIRTETMTGASFEVHVPLTESMRLFRVRVK